MGPFARQGGVWEVVHFQSGQGTFSSREVIQTTCFDGPHSWKSLFLHSMLQRGDFFSYLEATEAPTPTGEQSSPIAKADAESKTPGTCDFAERPTSHIKRPISLAYLQFLAKKADLNRIWDLWFEPYNEPGVLEMCISVSAEGPCLRISSLDDALGTTKTLRQHLCVRNMSDSLSDANWDWEDWFCLVPSLFLKLLRNS